jgi:hypothetical protein
MQNTNSDLVNKPLTKKCRKCEQEQSTAEFNRDNSKSDGYSNYCRPCRSGKTRAEMESNKKKLVEKRKERENMYRRYWGNQKWECYVCKQSKLWLDFKPSKKNPNRPSSCCIACEKSSDRPKMLEEVHEEWRRLNLAYYNA